LIFFQVSGSLFLTEISLFISPAIFSHVFSCFLHGVYFYSFTFLFHFSEPQYSPMCFPLSFTEFFFYIFVPVSFQFPVVFSETFSLIVFRVFSPCFFFSYFFLLFCFLFSPFFLPYRQATDRTVIAKKILFDRDENYLTFLLLELEYDMVI
jgi:hypothetical protein